MAQPEWGKLQLVQFNASVSREVGKNDRRPDHIIAHCIGRPFPLGIKVGRQKSRHNVVLAVFRYFKGRDSFHCDHRFSVSKNANLLLC